MLIDFNFAKIGKHTVRRLRVKTQLVRMGHKCPSNVYIIISKISSQCWLPFCLHWHNTLVILGAGRGDSSVEEHWTHDQKVTDLTPSRSGRRILFFRVNFLCWLLFWYSFHPCVACKRAWSFCQKCGWQVTAKPTCTLCMWLQIKWHCKQLGCMVCMAHVTTK